jgi:adenine deaminase
VNDQPQILQHVSNSTDEGHDSNGVRPGQPNPFVYPGFSLHDELGLLVRSGLTPAEALRTATINPARFLGVADSLGTVASGKVADLVLLDANPLTDIANTKRIRAVIQGGRLLNRGALDAMLARARARAAADRN